MPPPSSSKISKSRKKQYGMELPVVLVEILDRVAYEDAAAARTSRQEMVAYFTLLGLKSEKGRYNEGVFDYRNREISELEDL